MNKRAALAAILRLLSSALYIAGVVTLKPGVHLDTPTLLLIAAYLTLSIGWCVKRSPGD
jgi:hypothetical protein